MNMWTRPPSLCEYGTKMMNNQVGDDFFIYRFIQADGARHQSRYEYLLSVVWCKTMSS